MASHYIGCSYLFFWRLLLQPDWANWGIGINFQIYVKRVIRFKSCLFNVCIHIHRFPHKHFIPDNEPDSSLVKDTVSKTTPGIFLRTGYSSDDALMRAAKSNEILNIIRTPNERNNEIETRE